MILNQLSTIHVEVEEQVQHAVEIETPEQIAEHINQFLGYLNREALMVIGADVKNRVVIDCVISIGAIDKTMAIPAEIFKPLLLANAARYFIGHVHPSGDVTPSSADINQFKMLKMISKVMELPLLDSVIVGQGNWQSIGQYLKEHGDADDD